MPKIRNILIFIAIGVVLFGAYFFFVKKEKTPDLVTNTNTIVDTNTNVGVPNYQIVANALPVLLSIQDIKLDDSLFFDPTFKHLKDASIILIPDGNEGRPNPFAPIGFDTYEETKILTPTADNTTIIKDPIPNTIPNTKTPNKTN
ncbi:MAG: hypothetical protein M3P22_00250 [bacterium]|nr:hypothetical protein [bacterium]